MKSNRRNFLKLSSLLGLSVASRSVSGYSAVPELLLEKQISKKLPAHFNMSGYAAPRLETVRIGFIGLGNRGPGAVERMRHIEGVDIKALCDLRPDKVNAVKKSLEGSVHHPEVYTGKEDEW